MTTRDVDVLLFGATGFTGALVASELAQRAPDGLRVALAGRNPARLEAVRAALPSPATSWPVHTADSADDAGLLALARRSRVILTTVGPYTRLGLPLVRACAEAGTHYVDLTGEVPFMRASIDAADAPARASGARIVHTCGFDSIPSDLGMWLLHRHAPGATFDRATLVVEAAKGGASGGTAASMVALLEDAGKDRALRRLLVDPYSLSPDRASEPDLGRQPDAEAPRYDADLGRWIAPFFMAPVNTRVVRRSNSLLGHIYGRDLRYSECMGFKPGFAGASTAWGVTLGMGAGVALMSWGPTRSLVGGWLPKSGEGPSERERAEGYFRTRTTGWTTNGRRIRSVVSSQGDPGYASTARMITQAALCLAVDEDRLPRQAGVLTPAVALGDVLVGRLRAAGMTLDSTEAA